MKNLEICNVDYSGKNPAFQRTETRTVSELPKPFMIPEEAPFFTRNLVLRGDGAILTRGKDYWFEDYLTDFEEMIGKTVCATIQFSNEALNKYKKVSITYQKVCDPIITRSYLLSAIEQIFNSDKKYDWKDILGKPETYAPAFHTHDIREKAEAVGFGDLVLLFKQYTGQQKLHGLDIYKSLIKIRDAAYTDLNNIYQKHWNTLFSHIQNGNKPHPMTKADIGLGVHPNYGTATVEEDRLGKRSDVISTPQGVSAALENYDVDSDGYLRQGSLPFSYYGTGIYIPPPISGSFEGLGTNTGGNALCVESNGWTTLLTRGYDSKVRKLYYYYNKNIYSNSENFVFSGYAYDSQVMENNGHVPNHILSGSSGRILVIGDKEAGQYYITLGNGTLDATSHLLIKMDMSAFIDSDGFNMWHPDKAYVMMIGKYVYIIAQQNAWYPGMPEQQRFGGNNDRRRSFYRIPVADLYKDTGEPIKFVKQLINYQNSEGEWLNNQEYVDVAKNVVEIDSNGKKILKRCVIGYDTPPDTAALGNPWRCQWFNMENPTNKNVAAIRMFHNTRYQYKGVVAVSGDWWFCIPFTFDTTSNTLALDPRFFRISRDLVTGKTTVPEGRNVNEWYHGTIGTYCAGHAEVAATFIPKLGYAACRTNNYNLPYNVACAFMGYNLNASGALPGASDWDIFNQDLTNLSGNGYFARNIPLDSPFGFTTKPLIMRDLWEYNGAIQKLPIEIFNALNRDGTKTCWARQAKTNYDYHAADMFNFKYIPKSVIGRTPSTMFGPTLFGNLTQAFSSRIPSIGVSSKDKYGVQYGVFNYMSMNFDANNDAGYINGGLYYADTSGANVNMRQESGGAFKLSLLGNHTYDTATKTLTVDKIPGESVYVTRTNLIGLVKTMLGGRFADISTEAGGRGPKGEWYITVYIGAKEGTSNVYPSVAKLVYHYFDNPAETYGIIAVFNWTKTGNLATGEKTINFTNIQFPSADYGAGTNKIITTSFNYNSAGQWGGTDSAYSAEALQPTVYIDYTDQNNYEFWMHSGINIPVPLNSASSSVLLKKENGAFTTVAPGVYSQYNAAGLSVQYQLVTDNGLCRPLTASTSGGAALYCQNGKLPADTYALLQAVFIEGNWTLFVNSDMTAVFNGSEKKIPKTNYDLSELGIDQKNKLFYLYAMSGKTEGYYDLTLSERTASPYHLLVATIKTNSFGIEEINIEQNFAISGFSISTSRNGGIVPASSGTQVEAGSFKTVTYEDLFKQSTYN